MVQYWPILVTLLVALASVEVLSARSKHRSPVSSEKSKTKSSPRIPISKAQSKHLAFKVPGTTYIRWGHTKCPDLPRTFTVFTGKSAGSQFSTVGGGTNYLCMPLAVEYADFQPGIQSARGFLYGVEYETQDGPLRSVHNHDAPCAVCLVKGSIETLMIPGQLSCPQGWRVEYRGYLMSSQSNESHFRTMFECLDQQPQKFIGGAADENDVALFVHVEANCETLPCPPYRKGREITCVVCSHLAYTF